MNDKSGTQIIDKITDLVNLFKENDEWIHRYAEYSEDIINNTVKWDKPNISVKKPFYIYSTVGNRNQRKYDLRFHGQSVGSVSVNRDGEVLLTGKNNTNTEKYFGKEAPKIPKDGVAWRSVKATEFRQFFRDLDKFDINVKSHEHQLESRLLAEFSKGLSRDKALLNIQPVHLFDFFFQMPTPISASRAKTTYAMQAGGGIDILARCKHKDGSVHLCVIEVKDENKPSEPQAKAMEQALSYAVFIASLLRNTATGAAWWKLFGFNRAIPTTLHIDVVTIMPKGNTTEFLETIPLQELNTVLHPSTLYYDTEEYINDKFIFSGTFPMLLKK